MPDYVIYALVDPRTRLVRYIGCSARGLRRAREHVWPSSLRKHHTSSWIKSLLGDGLMYEVALLETAATSDIMHAQERWWIAFGRACGWDLTNHTDGGEGTLGIVRSAETRARHAAALRGRKTPEETKVRISQALLGKPKTPEAVERSRVARTGAKRSVEAIARIVEGTRLGTERRKALRPKIRINLLGTL